MRHTLIATLCAAGAIVTLPLAAQLWEVQEQAIGYPFGAQAGGNWGSAAVSGDFNGDGFDDLLVGAAQHDYFADPGITDSGVAFLFLGSASGFGAYEAQYHGGTQNGKLGFAVAAGDFDNDGDDEFVYSEPGESFVADEAGIATVRYWSGSAWLTATALREGDGTPGAREPFDHFGAAFAVGDFDGDSYDDLAVGIPDENLELGPTVLDAGAVMIFHGTAGGLTYIGSQLFDQSIAGLGGAQANAHFGYALAAGDMDNDGYDDLAIGVPYREISGIANAGQVVVLFGGASGLSTSGAQVFDDTDLGGDLGVNDKFGYALAAADFDLSFSCILFDCYVDLAIGIPGEPVASQAEAGGVVIAEGSSTGLDLDPGAQFFAQNNTSAALEDPETNDRFGSVLLAANLDSRLGADLIIGVPEENVGGIVDQGVIHLLFGGVSGLGTYPDQLVVQHAGFTASPGAAGNLFGAAVAAGDFRDDGHPDAAIGVPGFHRAAVADSGFVQVLHGALFADGFESGGTSIWSAP